MGTIRNRLAEKKRTKWMLIVSKWQRVTKWRLSQIAQQVKKSNDIQWQSYSHTVIKVTTQNDNIDNPESDDNREWMVIVIDEINKKKGYYIALH